MTGTGLTAMASAREMHPELALDAINFDLDQPNLIRKVPETNHPLMLATCEYFHTSLLQLDRPVIKDCSMIRFFYNIYLH